MAYLAYEIAQSDSIALAGRRDVVLHITLAHFGRISREQGQALATWLYRTAPSMPSAIEFIAGDVVIFGTPEEPVVARLLEAPGADLHAMRRGLVEAADFLGVRASTRFDPWMPHVTVGSGVYTSVGVAVRPAFTVTRIGLFEAPVFSHYSFPMGSQ
jgi:2'-5' RNA ligase